MSGSGESIDYNLRPSKALERHLLADLISVAMKTTPEASFDYAGMGSVVFKDFTLFHKLFGFKRMFSAEIESNLAKRCLFNKPFPHVSLHISSVDSMLEQLDWTRPLIVWLDYDGRLEGHVYDALGTVASHAKSGTLLIVSVNVHYVKQEKESEAEFAGAIRKEVGVDRYDAKRLTADSFYKPTVASTVDDLMFGQVFDKSLRSVSTQIEDPLRAERVGLFEYRDGARMLTSVYFLGTESHRAHFRRILRSSGVNHFCKSRPYSIEIPILTSRERRFFEGRLRRLPEAARTVGLSAAKLKDFKNIYRYWPYHAEVDV